MLLPFFLKDFPAGYSLVINSQKPARYVAGFAIGSLQPSLFKGTSDQFHSLQVNASTMLL
jgi:hypothetical protein